MNLMLVALAAYLIGSIPFGLLLTRLAGMGDIRKIGSGNIGATNVLRTGRKGLAALTLLLDGLKGYAAILLTLHTSTAPLVAWIGIAAVLGHVFSIWLKFKGGKGVATTIGIGFGLHWLLGTALCATWLLMAAVFRYSSLSALVAIGALPVFALCLGLHTSALPLALISALVIFRHRDNIKRLLAGTEPKIGEKK